MQTGTIFPQPLVLASHLTPRGMRALVALYPEEPCRTGGPLAYSLPAANFPDPFWYQSTKEIEMRREFQA